MKGSLHTSFSHINWYKKRRAFQNCRRDLLDHLVVLNAKHLKRLMNEYVHYYHDDRTHLALEKSTPAGRKAMRATATNSRVVSVPRLGGLHHRYDLAA
jgi:putative transposase